MKYLDTDIIGYAIENHPRYGKAAAKILQDIDSGKLKAAASMLVPAELIGVLVRLNRILERKSKPPVDIQKCIDAVFSLPILWLELSLGVMERASTYTFPINGGDYIHVATMETASVHEIISADSDFDKVTFIKRIDPLDY